MSADTFSVRLRSARQRAGITQRELAGLLFYSSRVSISQWEHGRNKPCRATVDLAAGHLNVEPEWLDRGAGPMRRASGRVLG